MRVFKRGGGGEVSDGEGFLSDIIFELIFEGDIGVCQVEKDRRYFSQRNNIYKVKKYKVVWFCYFVL